MTSIKSESCNMQTKWISLSKCIFLKYQFILLFNQVLIKNGVFDGNGTKSEYIQDLIQNIFPGFSMISEVGTQELELMRLKIPSMEEKLKQSFPLCHEITPINAQQYQRRRQQLKELLKTEFNSEELQKFNDVLLGSIEGLSGQIALKDHLKAQFNFERNEVLDIYLKQKTEIKYYGSKKQKNYSLHQVKNLENLGNTFDIKAIKNHRKFRNIYKNSIKSAFKFIQTFARIQKQGKLNLQIKKLYDQFYRKAYDDQRKYIDMKKKMEVINFVQKQAPIAEIVEHNSEPQNEVNECADQQVKKQNTDDKSDIKSINTTAKKTKKAVKRIKKQQKGSQKENQKNEIEIKSQNQIEVTTPNPKKDKSQVTLDCFLKAAKQKSPKKQPVLDTVINQQPGNQNSMSMPFTMNKNILNQRERAQEQLILLLQATSLGQTQNFTSLEQLRAEFKSDLKNSTRNEQMVEQKNCHQHLCNLVLWDSRLEFQNHSITTYAIDFNCPVGYHEQIRYMDDSLQVYEDLVAQNLQEKQEIEMQEEQEEASSANNTIVPDGYLSEAEISSNEDAGQRKDMRLVRVLDGKQQLWQFSYRKKPENQELLTMIDGLEIIPVFDDEKQMCLPFAVMEMEPESGAGLTIPLKMDLLKEIHGYFNSKESLVKKLSGITDKLSQNALNNFIKQVSYKSGAQRLVKQEIIDQMKDIKQDFESELQAAKQVKDKQIEASLAQKNNQRDQKIQVTILQYDGPKHVFDLLKYLKEKGYRLIKKQLEQFLSSRMGQMWEGIKKQFTFKKPSLKQKKQKESAKSESAKCQNKNNQSEKNDYDKNSQMVDENEEKQVSAEKSRPELQKALPPAYKPLDFFFKMQQQKAEQMKKQNNGQLVTRERLIDKKRRQQQQMRKKEEQKRMAQAEQKARKQQEKRLRRQKREQQELAKIKKGDISVADKVQLSQHQVQEQRKDGRQRRGPRRKYMD